MRDSLLRVLYVLATRHASPCYCKECNDTRSFLLSFVDHGWTITSTEDRTVTLFDGRRTLVRVRDGRIVGGVSLKRRDSDALAGLPGCSESDNPWVGE